MFSIKRYEPSYALQWDAFVAEAKNGHFMFQRNYMDYHADRFADHSLCIFRGDALFAVMPACEKEQEFLSHAGLTFGGILSDEQMKTPHMLEVFDSLARYLRDAGFVSCIYKALPHIYHRAPAEEDKYALSRHGATLRKCEVTSSILRAQPLGYSERRERGIKKAHKAGIAFRQSQDFDGYFTLLSALLQEKHEAKPTHTAAEMGLLAGRFPENIILWTAVSPEGALLAGVILYLSQQVAHAQYIAASKEGRDSGALDALFDHLINSVCVAQPYFDFGISTEEGGKHLNAGLITQKEEFGARAVVHETFQWSIN